MRKLLIKNGSVVTGGKTVKSDILIENGKVVKIAEGVSAAGAEIIDAAGLTVMPGFVDMHVHLREPGQEYKEDIESGAKAAVKGGVTALACMPNTVPVLDNPALVSYVANRGREVGLAKILPVGCITKGQKGEELSEFGLMKKAGAVALSDDGKPVEKARMMRFALEYAKGLDLLIISHCEDKTLSEGGDVNEGYNSTISGLKGIPRAAEEVAVARDIILAETLGAKIHIAHVSTEGAVRLVREAKARGVKVTAETCPHYFALTDDAVTNYDTNTKVNPPLRTKRDAEAIIAGLVDGTIDCIVTDHAPHHIDDKSCEYAKAAFGISGLETLFALCYTHLVKTKKITAERLSALLSDNPKKILGLGESADFAIVETEKKYKIKKDEFVSKGKNTPFDGAEVFGRVVMTIVDGEVKYVNR